MQQIILAQYRHLLWLKILQVGIDEKQALTCINQIKRGNDGIEVVKLNNNLIFAARRHLVKVSGMEKKNNSSDQPYTSNDKKISLIFNGDDCISIPVMPNVKVKDPTGAGDSFAGVVLGYIANYGIDNPVKAVIHGSAVASYTVSGFGLENLCKLDKDDLNKKINQISIK